MDVRFYLDPETDEPHIYNRGIAEEEVVEALRSSGEDRPGGEEHDGPAEIPFGLG